MPWPTSQIATCQPSAHRLAPLTRRLTSPPSGVMATAATHTAMTAAVRRRSLRRASQMASARLARIAQVSVMAPTIPVGQAITAPGRAMDHLAT
ncbi:MAG: hypothetical protein LBH48_02490, partial [Bifidobacteriaceae bacterium]|nr:hypothetical protein [Bifidobacteriaceae bacterium]